MIEFGERSPYERFAAVSPLLLNQGADTTTVPLLGQAISDALDRGCTDDDVRRIIGALETARINAAAGEIDSGWELPLSGLLGVLTRNESNRRDFADTLDPSNETLRNKVLASIDAGSETPAEIGARVQSPTTVISRALRQLADEGRVEPAEPVGDGGQRRYQRVATTEEGVGGYA